MSRVGKLPVLIPEKVTAQINGQEVKIKGPLGELSFTVHPRIKVELKDKEVILSVKSPSRREKTSALWGTNRAIIASMVKGVVEGYEKTLEIQGVGYNAKVQGNKLTLEVGFSHEVNMEIPKGLSAEVKKNDIIIKGSNKELVGQFAADVRDVRPPEPYKGKGIRYKGEHIVMKEGKKAAGAEGTGA